VKPVDIIEEIFIADLASLEWEVAPLEIELDPSARM
jgi:hypothetical protein